MNLHLIGPETRGGAYQAAMLAIQPNDAVSSCLPTPCQQAYRTIGGYRSHQAEWDVRWAIRKHQPDTVQLHNVKNYGSAAIYACRAERVPVYWHCYDYWIACPKDTLMNCWMDCWGTRKHPCISCYQPKSGHWPWIAKVWLVGRRKRLLAAINLLTGIRALSQHSACLLAELGVSVPIRVEPLKVTVPVFHVERIPNRVLFVGWRAPNKGLQVFWDACQMVRIPIDDHVIGPHPDGTGGLSRVETLREIARAAVLVVPEQWPNPQAVVIEEAKLLGTPVIASDIGGLPEQQPTRLCQPNRPAEFALAIEKILYGTDGGIE